jgi:uncharacterized membrane protein
MWQLYLGVILFGGVHLWSILMPLSRNGVRDRLGRPAFMGLYTLISLIGIALLAWAYQIGRAGPASLDQFYEPLYGAKHVAFLLILVGFILIFSNKSQSHIRQWVKHPFSVGIALWSIAHLMMNGEKAVVVMFGLFLLLALLDIVLSLARGKNPVVIPRWPHDLRGILVGVVLYLVFMFGFHPYILNIPVAG